MIFRNTAPEIATARLKVWQRKKKLAFLERVAREIRALDARGLERKAMADVLSTLARGLEK